MSGAVMKTPSLLSRLRFPLMALALLVGFPAVAQAQNLEAIQKRGKLMVAINLSAPPFGTTDTQMEPAGYDVDIAKLLAKDLSVTLQIVPVTNESRVPTLLTGKADIIISVLQITTGRAKSVMFSSPYGMHQSLVLAPAGTKITSLADLAGKRVGVARGSVYSNMIASAKIPGIQIIEFVDDSATLNALVAGQVDAVGTVTFLANEIKKRYPDRHFEAKVPLQDNIYAMGLRPGDFDLLRFVNTFIFVHDHDGQIPAMYEKWMGEPLKNLPVF
jgi:polar amino acid transport system substrate-binding protein